MTTLIKNFYIIIVLLFASHPLISGQHIDKLKGFQIEFSDYWEIKNFTSQNEHTIETLAIIGPKTIAEGSFPESLSITKKKEAIKDLTELKNAFISAKVDFQKNRKVVKESKVKIGEHRAYMVVTDYEYQSLLLTTATYFMIYQGHTYAFAATGIKSNFKKKESEFHEMVKSFKLLSK